MKLKRFDTIDIVNEDYNYESESKRFKEFIKELEHISKKYNIMLHSTGGVNILSDSEKLELIQYSDDPTSGDLDILDYKIKE